MIPTLQSLRFVFVTMIFLSHFSYREIRALDAGGDCGVAFFFLLSGFVCSLGYGRQLCSGTFRYGTFLRRRFQKLYPLHLLLLLFFLFVSRSAIDGKVLLNAVLLQSWIPDSAYYFSCNGVSWFLSSLLFCYLAFPLVYRHVSRKLTVAVLAIYVIVLLLTPYDRVNAVLYVHPMVRFVDFYLGMALYRVYERQTAEKTFPDWVEWSLVGLLLVAIAIYPYADAKLRNAPLYWLVLMPTILVFARGSGAVSRLLSTKPMLFLGSLSMPFFLTHQMLIGIVQNHLPTMPAVLMLAVCLCATLMVSWGIQIIFSRLFRL